MLRRTTTSLFVRRTKPRLSGGDGAPHPQFGPDHHAPPADETWGIFCQLNGKLAIFRVIDPKWILNRLVNCGRDGYVGANGFYPFLWFMWWKLPQMAMWGDKKPPRKVDWNKSQAVKLPAGFDMTLI
jgi:hypothetical protein